MISGHLTRLPLLMAFTLLVVPAGGEQKRVHAPLPAIVLEAKTVYIDNQTEIAKLGDRAFDELTKWGRFRIVDTPKKADLVFLFSAREYQHGTTTRGKIDDSGEIQISTDRDTTGATFLTVVDPTDGTSLWTNSKRWGNLFTGFRNATRSLIKELRARIEEQEAGTAAPANLSPLSQPAATPQPAAQPLAQALTIAGEPQTSEVMVKSEPSGADIMVNGKFVGNTPSSLRLPAGDQTITVEMSGYKTWKRTVTVTPGSNVALKATLESN